MRILCLDVGMGTNDLLLHDPEVEGENQIHAVLPSTTRVVAAEIARATRAGRPVVFRGVTMGGGPSRKAMGRHVERGLPFFAAPDAARTFSDDLDEVADMGVTLVSEEEARGLASSGRATEVVAGDLRLPDLLDALAALGVPVPDALAVAVQDHGAAPAGVSDRVNRFRLLRSAMEDSSELVDFFYAPDRLPAPFTRMAAVARAAEGRLPLVVADTGPAALWGAFLAAEERPTLAVNYGNGHTLMSLVTDGRLDGLFEHHTRLLDFEAMSRYARSFAAGTLTGEEVYADGGHGALPVSEPFDLHSIGVTVTGPRRRRFMSAGFDAREASLYGAMMITGCWGLARAAQRVLADR